MKALKTGLLWLLLLIAIMLCSVVTMKIMDLILTLNNTNIVSVGLKSGFIAWVILVAIALFRRSDNNR